MSKKRLNCENCGQFFYRYPSQITEHTKYCSFECKSKDKTVELECERCGDVFRKAKSSYEKHGGRYCSRECQNGVEPLSLECDNCGKEFEKYESQIEYSGSSHCSWECRYEDRGWEPGYGESWYPQRRKAIERDDYECQKCGIGQEECREKYYSGLHVHHKTPYREFDSDVKAHKLDNLETLCPPCHREAESSSS